MQKLGSDLMAVPLLGRGGGLKGMLGLKFHALWLYIISSTDYEKTEDWGSGGTQKGKKLWRFNCILSLKCKKKNDAWVFVCITILFVTPFPQNKRDEHLLKRRNVPYEYICEDYDGDGDFRSVWSHHPSLSVCSERSIREDLVVGLVILDTYCLIWSHQLMFRNSFLPACLGSLVWRSHITGGLVVWCQSAICLIGVTGRQYLSITLTWRGLL